MAGGICTTLRHVSSELDHRTGGVEGAALHRRSQPSPDTAKLSSWRSQNRNMPNTGKVKVMAQRRQRFSTRDEVYLNSPGFEIYMGAGAVFLLVFTGIFIYSIKSHLELLVWPGLVVAIAAGFVTLRWLERREFARKLAKLEVERSRDQVTEQR